jgi:hypothetical protein
MSTLQRLSDHGLIKPPRWLPGSVQYETIMGSAAYGVSSETSDVDVYGWAIPQKTVEDADGRRILAVKSNCHALGRGRGAAGEDPSDFFKKNGRANRSATSIDETCTKIRENASWPVRRRARCSDT